MLIREDNLKKRSEKTYLLLLMLGHITTDLNQGALPAVLPFLVADHNLSLSAAGGLMLALTGLSSIIQPFLGYVSDRMGTPQLMSIGILLACGGLAALGTASSYPAMVFCVLLCGIGVALFHPEGGRMVDCVAQSSKGEAMGTFSLGGNIGFTLGPIFVAIFIPLWGLKGLFLFLIPAAITIFLLQIYGKDLKAFSDKSFEQRNLLERGMKRDNWKAFAVLALIILFDSIVDYGLITFLPLFWTSILGQSEMISGIMLAGLSVLQAFSTYIGGYLADRFGFRKIIVIGSALYVPAILFTGLASNIGTAVFAVIVVGLATKLIQSPTVALGQQYLPNHVGLASGITLGLAVSFGGIASPILGKIGDESNLTVVIMTLAVIGALVTLFSFFIPKENKD